MPQIICTMSPESHAIETMCRAAEQAAHAGDFTTARDKQAELASGEGIAPLMAEAVGRFIDRCREQQQEHAA